MSITLSYRTVFTLFIFRTQLTNYDVTLLFYPDLGASCVIDSNFLSSFQRWHFFSLNLTCSISFEVSADRLINDSFKVSLFFSSSYKFFTLSLFHWHYYDVPLCGFLSIRNFLFMVQSMSWTYGLILPLVLGNSQPWFLQIASIPFFSSSHMTLIILMSGCFTVPCMAFWNFLFLFSML